MNILLTGGSGFIGQHLRKRLSDEGHQVSLLARSNPNMLRGTEEYVPCDLAEAQQLAPALKSLELAGVNCLIHLAQANVSFPDRAAELWQVNTNATLQLLDWSRRNGIKRFCYASTGSVYGNLDTAEPVTEECPLDATSFYGATKIAAEAAIRQYENYFATVVWRIVAPYGPRQAGRLVPTVLNRVRTGQTVTLNRGASPVMNYLFIDDLIEAMARSLSLDSSHTINLGGPEALSVEAIATIMGEALGTVPVFDRTDNPAPNCAVDTARARSLLGWAPQTDFAEGIRRIVNG